MASISKEYVSWTSFVWHVIALPVYFFVFSLIQKPAELINLVETSRNLVAFNLCMLSCILLVTLVISRLIIRLVFKKTEGITYVKYIGWCIGETLVFIAFGAMYLNLMEAGTTYYFSTFVRTLPLFFMMLLMPYIMLEEAFAIIGLHNKPVESESDPLIRFSDENQRMKLVIAAKAVLFIEAKENYVKIYYLENSRIKSYVLRSSMKRLEDLMSKHGMVRCQRAYYINPEHITLLRRNPEGHIFAELDAEGTPAIPVSKRYYDQIASIL